MMCYLHFVNKMTFTSVYIGSVYYQKKKSSSLNSTNLSFGKLIPSSLFSSFFLGLVKNVILMVTGPRTSI